MYKRFAIALAFAFMALLPAFALAQNLPKPDDRYAGYPTSLVAWPSSLPDLTACQSQEYYEPSDFHLVRYTSRVKVAGVRTQEHPECTWMLTANKWRWVMRPPGTKVAQDEQGRDLFDYGSPKGEKCGNPRPFSILIVPPSPPVVVVPPPPPSPRVIIPSLPIPPSPRPQFGQAVVTKVCVDRKAEKTVTCPTDWTITFVAKRIGDDKVVQTKLLINGKAMFRLPPGSYSVTEMNVPGRWKDFTGSLPLEVVTGKMASGDYVNQQKERAWCLRPKGVAVCFALPIGAGVAVWELSRHHEKPLTKSGGPGPSPK